MSLRKKWNDHRATIGSVESQSDLRSEPSITPEAIRLWEQTVLRCDYLFSNSAAVQNGLEREYGIRSEVIPTGVDTRFFIPDWHRSDNSRVQVFFVGSLRQYKQPQVVLHAAVRFPQADFRIAGDGPLAEELRQRIVKCELRNVSLLGPLPAEKLREEYQRADIFLFPSTWEGSPKVILEAAACGLPVIVRNSYSPETVVNGVTGYKAASEDEIFSYLEILIKQPDLRRELGRSGRRHSERYDWNVITRQWEAVFCELAERQEAVKAS